jgi:hypothetical protein
MTEKERKIEQEEKILSKQGEICERDYHRSTHNHVTYFFVIFVAYDQKIFTENFVVFSTKPDDEAQKSLFLKNNFLLLSKLERC